MAITGCTEMGLGKLCVTVDHDPRSTATDVPMGSKIISSYGCFIKLDDGSTTNVCRQAPDVNVTFGDATNPYIETESGTYITVGSFVFEGTECSSPTAAKWIIETTGDAQADVRLYDVTNSQVIAELTGQTASGPTIKASSSLSNLPASDSVFQVQILKSAGAGGNKARIYGFGLSGQ
jgi:hypothetical protein